MAFYKLTHLFYFISVVLNLLLKLNLTAGTTAAFVLHENPRHLLTSHLWALHFVLYADACGGACSLSRNLCSHIIFPVSLPLQICSPHPCPMFVPMLCIFTTEFHLSLLQMDAFLLKSKFYEVRILGPLP